MSSSGSGAYLTPLNTPSTPDHRSNGASSGSGSSGGDRDAGELLSNHVSSTNGGDTISAMNNRDGVSPGSGGSGAGAVGVGVGGEVQHRLMLKQTPIDTWSLREQLGLASAVLRSGDQNWVSVSRQMKPFSEEGRPQDWFSQKNCALQYNLLLEKVQTPRRKRGEKIESTETPGEAIVRMLTAERIKELKQVIEKQSSEMKRLKEDIKLLNDPNTDEAKIDEIELAIQKENEQDAADKAAHQKWLEDREEKKKTIQAMLKSQTNRLPLKGILPRRHSVQSSERNSFSDVDSPLSTPSTVAASSIPDKTDMERDMNSAASPLKDSSKQVESAIAKQDEEQAIKCETHDMDEKLIATMEEVPATVGPHDSESDPNLVNKDQGAGEESLKLPNDGIKEEEICTPNPASEDSHTEPESSDLSTSPDNCLTMANKAPSSHEEETPSVPVVTASESEPEDKEDTSAICHPSLDEKDACDESHRKTRLEEVIEAADNATCFNDAPTSSPIEANLVNVHLVKEEVGEVKMEVTSTESGDKDDQLADVTEPSDTKTKADLNVKVEMVAAAVADEDSREDSSLMDTSTKDDDDKADTSSKRLTRTRHRKHRASEVSEDDESLTGDKRQTRSKKNSERSDETAEASAVTKVPSNIISEEVMEPKATRETRRSAAKKSQLDATEETSEASIAATVATAADGLLLVLKEDVSSVENRRLSRLKELESSGGNVKSRRGSGATITSRSSSPLPSEDESEPDPVSNRVVKVRKQRLSKVSSATATQPQSNVASGNSSSEAASLVSTTEMEVEQNANDSEVEFGTPDVFEEEWHRPARNILADIKSHRYYAKLMSRLEETAPEFKRIALKPNDANSVKAALDDGHIKTAHLFQRDVFIILINFLMFFNSESKMSKYLQCLYNEFNESCVDMLLPLVKSVTAAKSPSATQKRDVEIACADVASSSSSVPTTPTPVHTAPDQSASSAETASALTTAPTVTAMMVESPGQAVRSGKTRGDEQKRKRASIEDHNSSSVAPVAKKRKRQ